MMDEIEIIYKHYEDTFSIVSEREKKRDLLFLIVIGFLGLLLIQLMYSLALSDAVDNISIMGIALNLSEVPLPVLVSTTWTFFVLFLILYYQVTIHIDKQYNYLHKLEKQLSELLSSSQSISRESSDYLTNKYHWFRHWVWIFYTGICPSIVIIAILWGLRLEYLTNSIPIYHKIYDSVLGTIGIISVVLYLIGQWLEK
jgi:hypothetical protein